MISIKDYAEKHNITYEAARQSVERYKAELEGHIHCKGRTRFLDDEAEQLLDDKRRGNPIVVLQTDKDIEIQRLQDENKALLLKVSELQDLLLKEKDRIQLLQEKQIALLEAAAQPEKKDSGRGFLDVDCTSTRLRSAVCFDLTGRGRVLSMGAARGGDFFSERKRRKKYNPYPLTLTATGQAAPQGAGHKGDCSSAQRRAKVFQGCRSDGALFCKKRPMSDTVKRSAKRKQNTPPKKSR